MPDPARKLIEDIARELQFAEDAMKALDVVRIASETSMETLQKVIGFWLQHHEPFGGNAVKPCNPGCGFAVGECKKDDALRRGARRG
jgi:hypothetical protein